VEAVLVLGADRAYLALGRPPRSGRTYLASGARQRAHLAPRRPPRSGRTHLANGARRRARRRIGAAHKGRGGRRTDPRCCDQECSHRSDGSGDGSCNRSYSGGVVSLSRLRLIWRTVPHDRSGSDHRRCSRRVARIRQRTRPRRRGQRLLADRLLVAGVVLISANPVARGLEPRVRPPAPLLFSCRWPDAGCCD